MAKKETAPNPLSELISDSALREVMWGAEQPLYDAAALIAKDPPESFPTLVSETCDEAARQGHEAGRLHVLSLADQLINDQPPSKLPERTHQGTLFTTYAHSELADLSSSDKGPGWFDSIVREKKYIYAAAVIATSSELTRDQLSGELLGLNVDITDGMVTAIVTKFIREDLIRRIPREEKPGVYMFDALKHTPKFDRYMSSSREWQARTKLRTLAHKLGKTEADTLDTLMVLGSLFFGLNR